jgi:hypothetical protein
MRRILSSAILYCITLGSSAAEAATCTGDIRSISIEPTSGEVLLERVTLTNGEYIYWPRFCSMRVAANGVEPGVCKAIYSSLLSAQAQSRSITFYTSLSSCPTASQYQWQFVPGFSFFTVN